MTKEGQVDEDRWLNQGARADPLTSKGRVHLREVTLPSQLVLCTQLLGIRIQLLPCSFLEKGRRGEAARADISSVDVENAFSEPLAWAHGIMAAATVGQLWGSRRPRPMRRAHQAPGSRNLQTDPGGCPSEASWGTPTSTTRPLPLQWRKKQETPCNKHSPLGRTKGPCRFLI